VRSPLARYLYGRLLLALVVIWGLATIVFLMIKAIPGDEAQAAAGISATPAQLAQVRTRLGLDLPIAAQYLRYLGRMLHGDLGTSIITFRPVLSELAERIPPTVELVSAAMLLNILIGIPLGMLAAVRFRRPADTTVRWITIVGSAVPTFVLGLLAQSLFGLRLGVFPISGAVSTGYTSPTRTGLPTLDALLAGNLTDFADAFGHLVLPAITLAIPFVGFVARIARSAMLGALHADHATVVRAKGASQLRLVLRHALPNGLTPIVTMVAMQFGWMFSATVLVETIFSRPGVGSYLAESVTQKDTFAVLALVLFIGTVVAIANLLADMVQLAVDPRVRARIGVGRVTARGKRPAERWRRLRHAGEEASVTHD
jgi:peptide/nickel transport system permease protein